MDIELVMQPKQWKVLDLVENSPATWVGMGGGRGGSKSAALQRIMLTRRLTHPGTLGCILMRNFDQVKRYHEDVMMRTWPQLDAGYHKTERKISIPFRDGPPSEIQFSYAESLDDVIRRFRSANYFDIFIDQAEQFSEAELREIKQAVRWPKVPMGTCKLLLAFNMGGVGIGFLRQKFHFKEYTERETAEDFSFVHVAPFDNVEWVRPSLERDGLTEKDYYSWNTAARKAYCSTRSDYGRALVSQDEALVQRDFEGSWDVLEGAYFGRSFDRDKCVKATDVIGKLLRPWWERWLSQDWGRGHYCVTYWHASGQISPAEALALLGWKITLPLKVVVTYREYIAGGEAASDGGAGRELDEADIARKIVALTPDHEREQLSDFFLSPDAKAKRQSTNTIRENLGEIMTQFHMPYPRDADTDRKGGWALMSSLLLSSKRQGSMGDQAWIISADCAQLISAIPLAMRSLEDRDDVVKTDLGQAKIEQDVLDSCLAGDTLVCTEYGEQRIDSIAPGTHVWTRNGLRRVRNAWLTRRNAPIVTARFTNGVSVTCTENHRFYVQNDGFVPIGLVRYGVKMESWKSDTFKGRVTPSVTLDTSDEAEDSCTGSYGRTPTVLSLQDIISTIRTTIRRITTWATLNASVLKSTSVSTQIFTGIQSTWPGYAHWLSLGTAPQRVRLSMPQTDALGQRACGLETVTNAPGHSSGLASDQDGSVLQRARRSGAASLGWIMLKLSALSAGRRLSGIDTLKYRPATYTAVQLCELRTAGFADVYDLEVDGEHEFFANGILVHNCRYGLKSKLEPGRKPNDQVVADRIREMQEAGLDEHSLTIHAYRMTHDLAEQDAGEDIQLGRRHGGRIIRR